ncbi:MAG TPA: hypothetical protein VMW04_00475 [Patescibacteria group bacterium]|nr:hypothetical protein [Patescibacteria group bacterium]
MTNVKDTMIPDLSFAIGPIMVTPLFWGLAGATVISSFAIWRYLKEDYPEEIIFGSSLAVGVMALIFSRLFFVLFNLNDFGLSLVNWLTLSVRENFSLVGAFMGAVLIAYWQNARSKRNPWEFLDALTLPIFFFLVAGGGGTFLTTGRYWSLAYLGLGLWGILTFPWLKRKYRSFTWYQSGKTGFLISFSGSWIFALLFLLAFLENGKIYLSNWAWLFSILVCLGILYYRSERDLKKDWGGLFKGRLSFKEDKNGKSRFPGHLTRTD